MTGPECDRMFAEARNALVYSIRALVRTHRPDPLKLVFVLVHESSPSAYRQLAAAGAAETGAGVLLAIRERTSSPLDGLPGDEIANIEGIVRECRREMDKACAMHTYAVGRCGGDCSKGCAAEDDMGEKFNASMAEAAGALQCLLRYVDNIRSDAAAKTRRASNDRESGVSHAAEE